MRSGGRPRARDSARPRRVPLRTMALHNWRTIVKLSLLCGAVAPIVGGCIQVAFWWFGWGPGWWPAGRRDVETVAPFSFAALILMGPGGLVVGAADTWLLTTQHARSLSTQSLLLRGVSAGMILGLFAPLVSALTLAGILVVVGAGEFVLMARWLPWMDPRNPIMVVGVVTGGILGAVVTLILARRSQVRFRSQ